MRSLQTLAIVSLAVAQASQEWKCPKTIDLKAANVNKPWKFECPLQRADAENQGFFEWDCPNRRHSWRFDCIGGNWVMKRPCPAQSQSKSHASRSSIFFSATSEQRIINGKNEKIKFNEKQSSKNHFCGFTWKEVEEGKAKCILCSWATRKEDCGEGRQCNAGQQYEPGKYCSRADVKVEAPGLQRGKTKEVDVKKKEEKTTETTTTKPAETNETNTKAPGLQCGKSTKTTKEVDVKKKQEKTTETAETKPAETNETNTKGPGLQCGKSTKTSVEVDVKKKEEKTTETAETKPAETNETNKHKKGPGLKCGKSTKTTEKVDVKSKEEETTETTEEVVDVKNKEEETTETADAAMGVLLGRILDAHATMGVLLNNLVDNCAAMGVCWLNKLVDTRAARVWLDNMVVAADKVKNGEDKKDEGDHQKKTNCGRRLRGQRKA